MHTHSRLFKLTLTATVCSLVFGSALPPPALAQTPPPSAVTPDQDATDPPARVGRIAQITGSASFHTATETQWAQAAVNYPLATGDALWVEPNGTATLDMAPQRMTLAGGSELDIAALDAQGLQAVLPQGEAYLQLSDLAPGEAWSLQTPRGLVQFQGPGRYAIAAGDTATPTVVTVLAGSAQVSGPGVNSPLSAGQAATITGSDTFQAAVGPAQPDSFITAMQARERPALRPAQPPPPAVVAMPGGEDLAQYGSWESAPDYGTVWYPQVASGWEPYRDGHWAWVSPWGWTWIDDAPWGFAPFHYGRWLRIHDRWAWYPGAEVHRPVYAPALVTFFGVAAGVGLAAALSSGSVGWVPLGPREAYHPWYRSSPRYVHEVNSVHVTRITNITTINNYVNRSAATMVSAGVMTGSRPVRPAAHPVPAATLAGARVFSGHEPVRPTAATAGLTQMAAQRMHLPPPPAGVAPRQAAPGPEIHARPAGVTGSPHGRFGEARPPLAPPGGHPAAAMGTAASPHNAASPASAPGAPQATAPGRPDGDHAPNGHRHDAIGQPQTPGLRGPEATHGGPPAVSRPGAAGPATAPPQTTGRERPNEPTQAGAEPGRRPAGQGAPPATPAPHDRAAIPQMHGTPQGHTAPAYGAPALRTPGSAPMGERGPAPQGQAPQSHAAPAPSYRAPMPQQHNAPPLQSPQAHASPAPQVHSGPTPQFNTPSPQTHAAPPQFPASAPQAHAAPAPQVHAPAPQAHAAPPPQFHAPAPQAHAAPPPQFHAPAPQAHAAPPPQFHAPAPQAHAAPPPQFHAPAPQAHAAPPPQFHAPAPQAHAAPPPQPHPAPAPHPAPHEKRPGEK